MSFHARSQENNSIQFLPLNKNNYITCFENKSIPKNKKLTPLYVNFLQKLNCSFNCKKKIHICSLTSGKVIIITNNLNNTYLLT